MSDADSRGRVPEGVIRGIEDLIDGRTAGPADLDAALEWMDPEVEADTRGGCDARGSNVCR